MYSTCLFVCWGGGGCSPLGVFHSYKEGTIIGGGCHILTYAWHSWPLSNEDSLAYHTDIGLYWSSPRTRETQTYCRAFGSGADSTCFYDLGLLQLGFEHPSSNPLSHRCGFHMSCSIDTLLCQIWNNRRPCQNPIN